MKYKIAPSVLSADFTRLCDQVKMVEAGGADWHHLDVMDGHFVPNITFGPFIVKAIKKCASIPLDVHLMIEHPDHYIEQFAKAGADYITVHYEACTHLHRTLQLIKSFGVKAGVSINPHTPVSAIEDILCEVNLVLIMSVNPGFGGQSFIKHTIGKIERLRRLLDDRQIHDVEIEVDGGIKLDNIELVASAGANVFVSGSGIYKADDPAGMVKKMKEKLNGLS